MDKNTLLLETEERLNLQRAGSPAGPDDAVAYKYSAEVLREIGLKLQNKGGIDPVDNESLFDLISTYIKRLGRQEFLRKNGEIKEATFYQYAYIDKSTWSEMKHGKITPSKKTLLKLILALELNQAEAEAMLSMGKERFEPTEIQDQIIEAVISLRGQYRLSLEDVIGILFEYQAMYETKKPFDCIYETPEMIAERKALHQSAADRRS